MDPTILKLAEFLGYAGAAFAGGAASGRKAFKELKAEVAWLRICMDKVLERLNIDRPHRPGNGKVEAELGLASQSHAVEYKRAERAGE